MTSPQETEPLSNGREETVKISPIASSCVRRRGGVSGVYCDERKCGEEVDGGAKEREELGVGDGGL